MRLIIWIGWRWAWLGIAPAPPAPRRALVGMHTKAMIGRTNYPDVLNPNVNLKHADCNGDGLVNFDDTLAIVNNLGLTYADVSDPIFTPDVAVAAISPVPETTVVEQGAVLKIPIYVTGLEDETVGLYGLSFKLKYAGSEPEIKYDESCMGDRNTDFIATETVDDTEKEVEVVITRITHKDIQCAGKVAEASILIDETPIGDKGSIRVRNARLINKDGLLIPTSGGVAEFSVYGPGNPPPSMLRVKAYLQGPSNTIDDLNLFGAGDELMSSELLNKGLLPLETTL